MRFAAISLTSSGRLIPCGTIRFATRFRTFSASLRSATAPISTGKLRPISAGSMSMWMSFAGGKWNAYSGSHELESASANRVPMPSTQSACWHFSLMNFVPQKPVMPRVSG